MERLRAAGLDPAIGHDAANLPAGAEVVVSTAIGADNPELALARERGVEPIHRGALLAELCAEKRLIAIAGTHGKTTTTAMAVWALRAIGADPAFFVGGEVPGVGEDGGAANAGWGEGEWVVAEADESDASFLRLRPEVAVDHQRRDGPPRPLGVAGRAARRLRAVRRPGRRRRPAARGRSRRRRATSGGQPALRADRGGEAGPPLRRRRPRPGRAAARRARSHNRANARAALAAIGLAGLDVDAAAAALADFPGCAGGWS